PDQRGNLPPKVNQDLECIKESVRRHIDLFPRMESHYVRKDSTREYLQSDLQNISQMYCLYKEWMADKSNKKSATYNQYRKIFSDEFNIGFFHPKKEQCELCDSYKMLSPNEKTEKLEKERETHLKNKDFVRKLKDTDKERAKIDSLLS